METLSSDSRQPPDGHEFPDYVETSTDQADYHDLYGKIKSSKSIESVNSNNQTRNFFNVPIQNKSPLNKINSVSNSDLSSRDGDDEVTLRRSVDVSLHTRSQSLIDMSSLTKQKSDRWSLLAEQRRKGYSKLKGLVIPEHVSESEPTPSVNIPEIKSHTATSYVLETKINTIETPQCHTSEPEPVTLPLISPPWSSTASIPKYSPAFKRKNLQVYQQATAKPEETTAIKPSATIKTKIDNEELRLDLSDSPKSLESITSPTRSDCSFDYVTNSFSKPKNKQESNRSSNNLSKLHKDIGKSEDESDNDSAVSSSQSSYISRCSPPPSPTRSCEMLDYESNKRMKPEDSILQCRLLKAASVEAINRKNILASAKCRSGRDLKVGSPVIQRKYEEEEDLTTNAKESNRSKQDQPKENASPKIAVNGNHQQNNVLEKKIGSLKPVPSPLKDTKTSFIKPSSLLKNNNKSMSVTDLRKNFEKFGNVPPPLPQNIASVPKEPKIKKEAKTIKSVDKKVKQNGEVVKLEAAKATVSPVKSSSAEVSSENCNRRKIVLCPKFVGGSIGITLAGGTDYETKEITVHKIRNGSVAYHDGSLKKGDKIISVNGKDTAGLTHAESVELLKEAVPKFIIVVEDGKEEETVRSPQRKSFIYESPEPKSPTSPTPTKSATHVITLAKDGAGLGFSIEGGKDSLQGDLPLRVKKIFLGGPAEKNGELKVGDELLAINDISLTNLSRIETWSLMKKLSDGNVTIQIHR